MFSLLTRSSSAFDKPTISSTKQYFNLLFGSGIDQFKASTSFAEREDYEKGFADYFDANIRPSFDGFEVKRILALDKFRNRSIFLIPLIFLIIGAVVWSVMNLNMSQDAKEFILGISGAVVIFFIILIYSPVIQYKGKIKQEIFPKIFSFFGPEYIYDANGGISMSRLEPSEIIPDHNGYRTEDHIIGSYQDVRLELCEAKLTKTTGSGKRRRTVTKFKGLFILCESPKAFAGKTAIMKDFGGIGNWLRDKFNKLENVQLEDPEFEKMFEAYSTDQVEARYLLTTGFMQRLLDLSELFFGSKVQCSFYDNQLLIMLPYKENLFETASVFEPALNIYDIRRILKEMNLIFQIIEILKLDQKIGL